jgi:hypothetical protein
MLQFLILMVFQAQYYGYGSIKTIDLNFGV